MFVQLPALFQGKRSWPSPVDRPNGHGRGLTPAMAEGDEFGACGASFLGQALRIDVDGGGEAGAPHGRRGRAE
jgi:hypothetical protein